MTKKKREPEKLYYWGGCGAWFAEPEPQAAPKPKRRPKPKAKKASKWW